MLSRLAKEALRRRESRKPPNVLPKDICKSWKIFRGDQVQVISGTDKGSTGTVLKVIRDQNKIIVEGANMARKHLKTGERNQGVILDMEKGIHISNVSLIDPIDKKPVRIEFMTVKDTTTGQTRKTRVSVRTGFEIPLPVLPKRTRLEGEFDTKPDVVVKRTYYPDLRVAPLPPGCTL